MRPALFVLPLVLACAGGGTDAKDDTGSGTGLPDTLDTGTPTDSQPTDDTTPTGPTAAAPTWDTGPTVATLPTQPPEPTLDTLFDDTLDTGPITTAACAHPNVDCTGGARLVTGTLTADLTLGRGQPWRVEGTLTVGEDGGATATLTLERGTVVRFDSDARLQVSRGSRLVADGRAQAPIVLTSAKPVGQRTPTDWGGVAIAGRAPVNTCPDTDMDGVADGVGCTRTAEYGMGSFGGPDDDDDSGVLRYVRIQFASSLGSPTRETNGLSLLGVGRGTVLEHVHVHRAGDDGIQIWGGTVDLRRVMVSDVGDDALEWREGWTGRAQYVALIYPAVNQHGMEGANDAAAPDALPRSAPVLQNVTVVGRDNGQGSDVSADGVRLTAGTAARIDRLLVYRMAQSCVTLQGPATYAVAWDTGLGDLSGATALTTSAYRCDPPAVLARDLTAGPFTATELVAEGQLAIDPMTIALRAPRNTAAPDARPLSGSDLLAQPAGRIDPWMDETTFVGAFGERNWAAWTSFPQN